VFVTALLAWAVATLPFSYWPSGSVGVLLNLYLKSVAVFVLLAGVVDSAKRLRLLTAVLVGCAAIIAVTAIRHFLSGVLMAGAPDRIAGYGTSGMAGNPNDLALLLNIIIPLNAALIAVSRGWIARCIGGIVLLLCAAGVIVTFSRAGFLTLAVTGALGTWQLVRRGAVGWVAALVLAALLVGVLAPGHYADRLSTVWDMNADATGSAQDRWRDTVVAATFATQHPLLGAGLGMDYLALNEARGAVWLSVHNAYLNYAVDLGVVGLTLFLAVFASAWWGTRKVERRPPRPSETSDAADVRTFAAAVRISLVGFAVAAFFHPVAYHAFFYYLAGLAVAVRNIDGLSEARA
jgi:O-antigen ligase